MNKQLMDYINGNVNVVKDEFILSRERNSRGGELIFVNTPDDEKPMYALWNCKKEIRRHKLKKGDKGYTIEQVQPKGTGGEKAYVMVTLKELGNNEELSLEASGLLLKLFLCVEWNTCRLIHKRDGVALTQKMMAEQFDIGIVKIKHLVSQLVSSGAIEYRKKEKAYYMSKNLVKKGRSI